MTRKICCVFLTLSVLIFIGAGCRDSKMATDAKVVFSNTLKGNFFFQPESKTAYDKVAADSTGKYQFVAEIQEPTFFRYVGVKQGFYSVYLTPGANVEIVESENGVEFKGLQKILFWLKIDISGSRRRGLKVILPNGWK